MLLLIVLAENVAGKVVGQITHDGVNMVSVVLSVVVLNQEHRALYAIVVARPGLKASGPCEGKIVDSRLFYFVHQSFGKAELVIPDIDVQ